MTYPDISPVAIQIGPVLIYWYGLMYLFAFVSCWLLLRHRTRQGRGPFSEQKLSDLMLLWAPLAIILGGRIGYVLFYQWPVFVADPLYLFKIWEGGMSFHGGLLGAIVAILLFARQEKCSPWTVADFVAPVIPIGLGLGRIGNFINGELWGRVTTVPWGMVFPEAGPLARHPTQLYEAFLEGLALWLVLWFYSAKKQPRMAVSGMFLMLYGIFRFVVEFFREPDAHIGFVWIDGITLGQWLCVPMIILGLIILVRSYYANVS